uniref:Uncharacterized protein n=1 Tax=Panagrolaimus sp. ES5 TaxID=591445 RepID=A0AC34F270_9BILA
MKQNPEPKIVKLYHQLFEEENFNVVKTDEFFLLRPHLQHLGSLFNSWKDDETLQKKKPIIQALVSSILRILEGEQGLKLFNACQTLGIITYFVGKKVESIPQAQCLLLPGTPEDFAKIFSQRCRDVIIGDSSLTLKICFLNTLLTFWSSFPKCLNNPLMFAFANDDIFDALVTVFSFPDLKPIEEPAVSIFVILLQLVEESKQNQFKERLSGLEDNIGIIPPHTHDHIITDQEQPISNGNNSNVFSLFLSFSSFVFADFDSKQQQDQTKLCLLILWHIINEPYVQNAIQDMHLSTNISLYKSPMLHRSASFAPISATPITLSTALLELLTDFNSTHLKHNFPFLHYQQSTVFSRLGKICKDDNEEQVFQVNKTCEYFPKVANQLINILSIIEHIRPKLEVLAHSYPTEEQTEDMPHSVNAFWSEKIDYARIAEELSNIEL